MSLIDTTFEKLRKENRTALLPFITAGDPDLKFTQEVLTLLAKHGASACEVGVPYSDPVADGPVIQASYTRALDNGVRVDGILDAIQAVKQEIEMPVVTMISYAIILRHGPQAYIEAAIKAGVSGAIVPDLPAEEAADLSKICEAEDFSLIQLVAPTTPRERAKRIAETSSGFLYYVSIAGITGERTELPADLVDNVSWLREQTSVPVCIGFGISGPKQVKQLSPIADGLIVGSAIVRRMANAKEQGRKEALESIGSFFDELVAAL